MKLSDLKWYDAVTIQCHDNPDADAISAGYGLYCYFADRGCKAGLIYSGRNKIKKSNLRLMIEKLNIPLEYKAPERGGKIEGLLITVDCQYGAGNVTGFEADQVAVIDHHPMEIEDLELFRIQPNLGSCATLVWSMLEEEKYPVDRDVNLGTALYYGLYTDTNQFAELFNPLDMDMRDSLSVNKRLMAQLRNSNISLKELEIAGIAMIRYNYNDDYRFAVIKAQPCDPNILGMISDFLLQVDVIDTCAVYNELNDGYKLSVRSCIREVNANELAAYLTEGIGSGGGHYEKAGGFISRKLYEEEYPTLHSEAYFNNRMTQYFDTFEILYAEDVELDLKRMKRYVRNKGLVCCLKIEDLIRKETQISIRTPRETVETTVTEGMYIAIERDGVVHFLPESRFVRYFEMGSEPVSQLYWENAEYEPTIKDWKKNRTYKIADYAKMCSPRDGFCIYGMPLTSHVKLFRGEDDDQYMLGKPGDYLAAGSDELTNIFIEPGDHFKDRFREL